MIPRRAVTDVSVIEMSSLEQSPFPSDLSDMFVGVAKYRMAELGQIRLNCGFDVALKRRSREEAVE